MDREAWLATVCGSQTVRHEQLTLSQLIIPFSNMLAVALPW